MLHTYRSSHITFLRSPTLEAIPGVVHAFSTRRGAGGEDLSIGRAASDARDRFTAAAGMAAWPFCGLRQVHSNRIHGVEDNAFANEAPEGDGLWTALPGLALGVVTADCVPILVAARDGAAVGAVHAGWRGTSEAVARRAVDSMTAAGVDPDSLVAAIGPHIGVCCMEVGEEVYEWFQQPEVFERRPEWPRPHLDLAEANRLQLRAAGIPDDAIEITRLCTRCRGDLFHSWRRDGKTAGRLLATIGLQPG